MKIAFVGDIHSNLDSLHKFINNNLYLDCIIQTGDLGVYFNSMEARKSKDWKKHVNWVEKVLKVKKKFKRPVYFCTGLHEDWSYLPSDNLKLLNMEYIKNGESVNLDGKTIGFIGGMYFKPAFDKSSLSLLGKEKRFFTKDEISKLQNKNLDILVTHTAATSFSKEGLQGTNKILDKVIEQTQPKLYFHGRHHVNYQEEKKGVKIFGLGFFGKFNKSYKIIDTDKL